MDITIIIPHYNSTQSLSRMLASIPHNDLFAVIVVDDQSTEGVNEMHDLIAKENRTILLTNSTSNKSAGTARNVGLEYVMEHMPDSKWIMFADADDYFLPGFDDKVIDIINTEKVLLSADSDNAILADRQTDIIFFSPTSVNPDGTLGKRHEVYAELIRKYCTEPSKTNEEMLKSKSDVVWSKLFRASLIFDNDIRFDEVIAGNDVMFAIKCNFLARQIEASKDETYCVTQGSGTLTTKKSEAIFDARLKVKFEQIAFVRQRVSKATYKQILPSSYAQVIQAYEWFGLKKALVTFMVSSKHGHPFIKLRAINPVHAVRSFRSWRKNVKHQRNYTV